MEHHLEILAKFEEVFFSSSDRIVSVIPCILEDGQTVM